MGINRNRRLVLGLAKTNQHGFMVSTNITLASYLNHKNIKVLVLKKRKGKIIKFVRKRIELLHLRSQQKGSYQTNLVCLILPLIIVMAGKL